MSAMTRKNILLILGPVLAIIVFFLVRSQTQNVLIAKTTAVVVLMAFWWITEAISIYVTAFLPVILFPILGIQSMSVVAKSYMHQIIFLFIGGFFLAYALERWQLHKRFALTVILKIGTTPSRLLFGFMAASYFLSMWILNTATTTLLLPAVLAVVSQVELAGSKHGDKLATPLLLGLAFASSIGGTATVIGTAPNMYLMGFLSDGNYTTESIDFAKWLVYGIPTSFFFFLCCYFVLKRFFLKGLDLGELPADHLERELVSLGKLKFEEKVIGVVFATTVLLWLTLHGITLGGVKINGWEHALYKLGLIPESTNYIKESSVAMVMSSLLFFIPSRTEKGTMLLRWEDTKRLPMGVIFLFGGGFALAGGISGSGLSNLITEKLTTLSGLPDVLLILILCVGMTFLTELTSNTSSTILVLPIIVGLGASMDIPPLMLLLPVTISASYAFMLPAATPPNTIVFGSERLTIRDMSRVGIWLNLLGAILITISIFTFGRWVFQSF